MVMATTVCYDTCAYKKLIRKKWLYEEAWETRRGNIDQLCNVVEEKYLILAEKDELHFHFKGY